MTRIQKLYWRFELTPSGMLLITPLFAFKWYEFEKPYDQCAWVRGFAIHWKRNRNLREGDSLFQREYVKYFDMVTMLEQVESR